MVECWFLNPNWWLGIRPFFSMTGFSRLSKSFSKPFDLIGNNEIGRYEVTSCDGLPSLGTIITSATFQISGTYFNRKSALIRFVNLTIPFLGSFFSTAPVTKSKPGAFFELMFFLIPVFTSFGVVNSISMSSRYLSSYWISSGASSFVLKTFSRWFANSSAFTLLSLAHSPCSFLCGGIWVIDFLIFLIACHSEYSVLLSLVRSFRYWLTDSF